ncbi:MAG: restriction endonuclease subunit S [Verrucomicrobia bacterium]|nr:restriction endonuclease subunit S [Verrucomicrobiota bacterium]
MKQGWQIKTIGDVCDVVNGGTPKTGVPEYWDGNHRWITPAEMGKRLSPYVSDTERKITDLGLRDSSARMLPPNSVILSSRAPIGHLVINTEPMGTNQGCKGLVPRSQVDHKFLYYYLSSIVDLLNSLGTGATFKELSGGKLKEVSVPAPPLAEQQRIVGLLDEAFEGLATAKANAEKNLQNARALFESHLQSVFTQRGPGWVETTLENCCAQIFAGGDVPKDRLSDERTPKFSVPIYSNGEKNDGLYGFTDVARVTKPSITVSARGTLGFTAIRTEPFLPVVRLIVLVPDETQITLSFLYYAVVGMDFGNTGTSIPQLTVPNFKESKLHIPSLPEQEAIMEKLDTLSEETQRLARLYEQKLAALEALKKSLLHQAFTGQL